MIGDKPVDLLIKQYIIWTFELVKTCIRKSIFSSRDVVRLSSKMILSYLRSYSFHFDDVLVRTSALARDSTTYLAYEEKRRNT
jgi:hypothetical protein